MKRPASRALLILVAAVVAGTLPVLAAEDIEPAVNTSAPAQSGASSSAAAARPSVPSPAPAQSPATPASPAASAGPSVAVPGRAGAPARGAAVSAGGAARDRVELENTQITGNRELPKVMYVVPWKKPDLGDFGGRPAKSLLDELLEPVDRDVFKRQNRYFEALQPDAGQAPARDEKQFSSAGR